MTCKKCGNDKFFSRYLDGEQKFWICSKCRDEQPIKKESAKKSPEKIEKIEGEL